MRRIVAAGAALAAGEWHRIGTGRIKTKKGHRSLDAPFEFWLPDLDSNQGPAD